MRIFPTLTALLALAACQTAPAPPPPPSPPAPPPPPPAKNLLPDTVWRGADILHELSDQPKPTVKALKPKFSSFATLQAGNTTLGKRISDCAMTVSATINSGARYQETKFNSFAQPFYTFATTSAAEPALIFQQRDGQTDVCEPSKH